MKRGIFLSAIIILIVIFSIGIVDGILALTNDLNHHLWLNLIGRWQSYDRNFYEIEFKMDGTFNEYFRGANKSSGIFHLSGNNIVLDYDPSSCNPSVENGCAVRMKFEFGINTLILITGEKKMFFGKVTGH